MHNSSNETLTKAALERIAQCPDPRLKEVMTSLVSHLHTFAREVNLRADEWATAINFLIETGRMCDERRNEFVLLSDTLGLSAVVDEIANREKPKSATESSLLGPFYRDGAPELPLGANIARNVKGAPLAIHGTVKSLDGKPVANALLDVWQASPDGLYDLQLPDHNAMNLRARFRTGADGEFHFRSVKTSSYPVPVDGPVGTMLKALGQHPYRPAHIHFLISADGYVPLTTALYMEGDKYLDSDAVFGARKSLTIGYQSEHGRDAINFDFVIARSGDHASK
ncbi:MAG TPA: dioxygenase [Sporolactobacillaceae bacterium]|nr:dioxygenase [Sporolactobacillaceae bacterium]